MAGIISCFFYLLSFPFICCSSPTFAAVMVQASTSNKAVGNWLMFGVFMLIVQILLGGITRLTGSGLSITEWDVVTGTLPPMSEAKWVHEFNQYKATPQYRLLNTNFTLSDFKFIFFWEWFHRLWARIMGMVFAVGFIYFLLKGYFKKEIIKPMIILFIIGALQGAVGWIMVASGLTGDAVYVKPTRLALHFILAMGLLSYTFWFALQLKVNKTQITVHKKTFHFSIAILILLLLQLIFGALMAGHKAATAAPTWPAINTEWLPQSLFAEKPWLINFIENKITIQFVHRGLAYLLAVLIFVWFFTTEKVKGSVLFYATRIVPVALVVLQVFLGIFTVLTSVRIVPNKWGHFEWIAQAHQLMGMCLLLSFVWAVFLVRRK